MSHFAKFSFFSTYSILIWCAFLIFHVLQWFSTHFTSYSVCFSFSMIFSFLAIFQVLHCAFLFFHVFQCVFFFYISGPTVCLSHFPRIIVFWPYSSSYSEHFSFSSFLSVSRYIPDHRVFVSLFPCNSVVTFFPRVSGFWPYSSSYSVHFSFSMFFFFLPYYRSWSVCVSFSSFQCFCHIAGTTVSISPLSRFSVFRAIFQIQQCVCLIFHVF